MAIDTQTQYKVKELISSVGRAAIHAMYPSEIEHYAFSLELATFDGETVDYLTFPIMPSGISKTENNRINIKKSYAGVTVINSKSFTPQNLTIKGNFGRAFKILIESGTPSIFRAIKYSYKNGIKDVSDLDQAKLSSESRNFDPTIKTGYGCIQILKAIINKAAGTDDKGRPFKLFAYCPALGESYLVVPDPSGLTITLNDSSQNMIHNYSLNLIVVAPITGNNLQGKNASGMKNILAFDLIQKSSSIFVSGLKNSFS